MKFLFLNYKMTRITILILISIVCLFACKKSKDGVVETLHSGNSSMIYPVALGNEWRYITSVSFNSVAFSYSFNDYSINRFDSITNFSTGDSVYALVCYDSSNTGIFHYTSFYKVQYNGLFFYAYYDAGSRVFLRQPGIRNGNELFAPYRTGLTGRSFEKNSLIDSLIIEPTPLSVIQYPRVIDQIWTYSDYHNPFYIGKVYKGDEVVITSAGTYNCGKFELLFDFNEDHIMDSNIHITQYISPSKGLIKETENITGSTYIDSLGNPVDTGTYIQTSILTSINF